MKKLLPFFCVWVFLAHGSYKDSYVTIAILAKDKAHTLPLYLSCIEKQSWPAHKTYLYIRTNNNNDDTAKILSNWLARVKYKYAGVYFDTSDVTDKVEQFGQHEWNSIRFKVLGKIRQESVNWALDHDSHYFVADCDNFIQSHTIEELVKTSLPIVAPLLRTGNNYYSNFHAAIDENGYYAQSPLYFELLNQEILGLVQVPVVHCTYLIRYEFLDKIAYDDNSYRYEYVIFSDTARRNKIPQYFDTRQMYGRITFAENNEQLEKEGWLTEFN